MAAPEQFKTGPLTVSIDVWSLGMSFYTLLTGVYPFFDTCSLSKIPGMVLDGELPFLDPRWRDQSFAEAKLVEVIKRTWATDANERIDINGVVTMLRDAMLKQRKGLNGD